VTNGIRDPAAGLKLRAFTGSALDYRLHKSFLERPPNDDQDISEWISNIGGTSSCIAANGLAAWHLTLGAWFIERVAEVQAAIGLSLTSRQDTYAFVSGGTGWTPFGIHEDYEPSIIFHLGPASKRVWVWEPPHRPIGILDGVPAFGGVSFRFEESLPLAREIVLCPGDVLIIPGHVHHVFHNDGPSAFIGLAIHVPDRVATAEAALRTFVRRVVDRERNAEPTELLAEALFERRGEFVEIYRKRLIELASAGFVDRPDRRLLESLRPRRGPFRLAHPAVIGIHGQSLIVRGRVLRVQVTSQVGERIRSALLSSNRIDAASLAQASDVSEDLSKRVIAAMYRAGGLIPA
jgi:hypothetical protein